MLEEKENKKTTIYMAILLVALVGGFLIYALAGSGSGTNNVNKSPATPSGKLIAESAPVDDLYSMFLCPCDEMALDRKNPCCAMAEDLVKYIDSQLAQGLSKEEVILNTAEKYGLNSIVKSKRDAVQAALAKRNPDLIPSGKISFNNAVGQKAPDFTLEAIDGSKVKLSDYAGKNVVLFFTEGSMCYPACWDQMAEFGNDDRFNSRSVVVLSITPDSRSEWQKIVEKTPKLAKAKIMFDTTRAVSSAYDVLNLASSMHKGNYPGHTYFIVDKDGVVRYTMDDPRMAIQNDKLFDEIKKLG